MWFNLYKWSPKQSSCDAPSALGSCVDGGTAVNSAARYALDLSQSDPTVINTPSTEITLADYVLPKQRLIMRSICRCLPNMKRYGPGALPTICSLTLFSIRSRV